MKVLRQSLSLLIGRRPPPMQVGALCRCPASGQVLLITSRGTGRWVIPKGWPMEGKSLSAAAATEAWEEAGVTGQIGETEIGRYSYDKDTDQGYAIQVEVRVFLLTVTALSADFAESGQRRRQWFSPREAAQRVVEPSLKQILLALPPVEG